MVNLKSVYEDIDYSIGPPDPGAGIEFRVEQVRLTPQKPGAVH